MFDGILAFQRDRGPVEDGIMKPGGPTAKLINAEVWDERPLHLPPPFSLGSGVGVGMENFPRDVTAVRNALAWAGFFPPEKTIGNTPADDPEFRIGLERFQRAFNLTRDGIMRPRGETERTLAKVIGPLVGVHNMRQRPQPQRTGPILTVAETKQPAAQAVSDEPAAQTSDDRAEKFIPRPAPAKPVVEDAYDGPPRPWSTDYEKQDPFIYTRIPAERRGEWDAMAAATERAKLGEGERRAYMEIFSVEGGTKPDGTAVGGVTIKTLKEVGKNVLIAGGISPTAMPKDLTDDQRIYVYRAYLDQDHTLGRVGGPDALNTLNDDEAAATLADSMVRDGGFGGMRAVKRAVNTIAPGTLPGEEVDRKSTFSAYASLVANVATRQKLLDAIAVERLKDWPKEGQRMNHFRFQ